MGWMYCSGSILVGASKGKPSIGRGRQMQGPSHPRPPNTGKTQWISNLGVELLFSFCPFQGILGKTIGRAGSSDGWAEPPADPDYLADRGGQAAWVSIHYFCLAHIGHPETKPSIDQDRQMDGPSHPRPPNTLSTPPIPILWGVGWLGQSMWRPRSVTPLSTFSPGCPEQV